MKKTFSVLIVAFFFLSFQQQPVFFTGNIVYKYQFQDVEGKDITDAMAKFTGKEQHYFINAKNYKAYNEQGELLQLYKSDSNKYYQLSGGKVLQSVDASIHTSKVFTVTKLKEKVTVAGYVCNAIDIKTDGESTIYYYSPLVKVDSRVYAKHHFGEWSRILKATGGALPLKFVMTNMKEGFIVWTSTAVAIKKQNLTEKDFQLPAGM